MVLNFSSVRIKVITADIFYVWYTVSSSFTENKNPILSISYEHSYNYNNNYYSFLWYYIVHLIEEYNYYRLMREGSFTICDS